MQWLLYLFRQESSGSANRRHFPSDGSGLRSLPVAASLLQHRRLQGRSGVCPVSEVLGDPPDRCSVSGAHHCLSDLVHIRPMESIRSVQVDPATSSILRPAQVICCRLLLCI